MTPRSCPVKDRPLKCNARVVGVLSVTEEVKRKKLFVEHFFLMIFCL